ncbi:MAG: carboxypeptidase-like regulatory domain-containing protein [Planctomycetota bacterium]
MARCATRQCSTVVVPVSAGAFSIPCLPPGSWRLLLAEAELAQASWAQAAEIVTRPGAVERVALDLRGLGWSELRGHVVLDGRPVADATVTVSRSPLGSGPSVRSDTDGRFGFPSLAAGRWFVTIGGSTDRAAVRRVVDLGSPTAGTLELDLATGTLHGHVEDADRGAAAASRIEVSDAWGAPVATATTDARGDFALRLAASQAYSLRAVRGDRASTQRQVAVASSHTTYAGDVSLRRGGRLRLQVCRVDGSDLIGTIYVEVRAPSGDSLLSISLAAAREVELEGLPPGPVAITAREHGDTAVGTAAPRVALDRVQVARIQLGRTASAPTLRR